MNTVPEAQKAPDSLIGRVNIAGIEGQTVGIIGSSHDLPIGIELDIFVERIVGSGNRISGRTEVEQVFHPAVNLDALAKRLGQLNILQRSDG